MSPLILGQCLVFAVIGIPEKYHVFYSFNVGMISLRFLLFQCWHDIIAQCAMQIVELYISAYHNIKRGILGYLGFPTFNFTSCDL